MVLWILLIFSVGETFLLRLVLAGRGEGEGWGDDAATGEDVTGGEGDMEDVTCERDMEDVTG